MVSKNNLSNSNFSVRPVLWATIRERLNSKGYDYVVDNDTENYNERVFVVLRKFCKDKFNKDYLGLTGEQMESLIDLFHNEYYLEEFINLLKEGKVDFV